MNLNEITYTIWLDKKMHDLLPVFKNASACNIYGNLRMIKISYDLDIDLESKTSREQNFMYMFDF